MYVSSPQVREWRPIGVFYFFLGSFLLAGLLIGEVDGAAFAFIYMNIHT